VRFPLKRATGSAVAPVAGLPTVTLGKDGAPTITVPKGDPPAKLVAQPLIEGTGPAVKSGQKITVHYTGVLYETGKVFDSSWTKGQATTFPIGTGGVIPGWDKSLVGRKVGSQMLLVIPPSDGYGDTGSGDTIPPGATLVFVVDILDAHA
jgi:peptidylprolyl isomerase